MRTGERVRAKVSSIPLPAHDRFKFRYRRVLPAPKMWGGVFPAGMEWKFPRDSTLFNSALNDLFYAKNLTVTLSPQKTGNGYPGHAN
jgi:hypothetical protein